MAYRATPHSTTGYSPFFLLQGREIVLPSNENLKAKVARPNASYDQRIENLKSSLKQAYKSVSEASRKSHQTNKRAYNCRAKHRSFKTGDCVYLYCPARKPGLSKKFRCSWAGPYEITAKISDLNYEIAGHNGRKSIFHLNRLKLAYNDVIKTSNPRPRRQRREGTRRTSVSSENCEGPGTITLGRLPLVTSLPSRDDGPPAPPTHLPYSFPPPADSPMIEDRSDLTYLPPDTPKSRRELQTTRVSPLSPDYVRELRHKNNQTQTPLYIVM